MRAVQFLMAIPMIVVSLVSPSSAHSLSDETGGPVTLVGDHSQGCSTWPHCPPPHHRGRSADDGWTSYSPLSGD
jgi:hypothetical protein